MKVAGRWRYVYRAINQFGQVVDVFVSRQRDALSVMTSTGVILVVVMARSKKRRAALLHLATTRTGVLHQSP